MRYNMRRERVLTDDGKFVNAVITAEEKSAAKKLEREAYLRENVARIVGRQMRDIEFEGAIEALAMSRDEFKMFPELYSRFMKRRRPAVDAPEVKKTIDEKVELKTKALEEIVEVTKEEKKKVVEELGNVKKELKEVEKTKEELAKELADLKVAQAEAQAERAAMQARLKDRGEPVRMANKTKSPMKGTEKITIV
jgi:DNA repair exonuclease SbcCD ATPase subunit